MNRRHLRSILTKYADSFERLNTPTRKGIDEGYKWRAVSNFKEHWDLEAEDFPSMFHESMHMAEKVINSKAVHPIAGLERLLQEPAEVEFVRECFRELFAEDGGDLVIRNERVRIFVEKINDRIKEVSPDSWMYPQNKNAAIFYLNLWRPEDNYIFKMREANDWANAIEFADDFGEGSKFSLEKYYKMCDELLHALQRYPEILELHKARFERDAKGFDDMNHLLVYDIIHCAHNHKLCEDIPSLHVSTKQRIRLAGIREDLDIIEEKIIRKNIELNDLRESTFVVPELKGQTAVHKKYGKGVIVEDDGTHIIVQFAEGPKKFCQSAIAKGFIKLTDIEDQSFSDALEKEKRMRQLSREIESLRIDMCQVRNRK